MTAAAIALDAFFEGRADSRRLYEAVARKIGHVGKSSIRVSKSQVAFKRRRNFAVLWIPGQYLAGDVAPLVLTLTFRQPDPSRRWKQIVQVSPHRFTHHLELFKPSDVDGEVQAWLQSAWDVA